MPSFIVKNMSEHTIINLDNLRIFHISEALNNNTVIIIHNVYSINIVLTMYQCPKVFKFAFYVYYILLYYILLYLYILLESKSAPYLCPFFPFKIIILPCPYHSVSVSCMCPWSINYVEVFFLFNILHFYSFILSLVIVVINGL